MEQDVVQRAGEQYVSDLQAVSNALKIDIDVAAAVVKVLAVDGMFLVTQEDWESVGSPHFAGAIQAFAEATGVSEDAATHAICDLANEGRHIVTFATLEALA